MLCDFKLLEPVIREAAKLNAKESKNNNFDYETAILEMDNFIDFYRDILLEELENEYLKIEGAKNGG